MDKNEFVYLLPSYDRKYNILNYQSEYLDTPYVTLPYKNTSARPLKVMSSDYVVNCIRLKETLLWK
jgi:hypothetical protein